MKHSNIKLPFYILIGLIAFFVITNPTMKDFKENTDVGRIGRRDKVEYLRNSNFLLFSIYSFYINDEPQARYLGIAKNFFQLK